MNSFLNFWKIGIFLFLPPSKLYFYNISRLSFSSCLLLLSMRNENLPPKPSILYIPYPFPFILPLCFLQTVLVPAFQSINSFFVERTYCVAAWCSFYSDLVLLLPWLLGFKLFSNNPVPVSANSTVISSFCFHFFLLLSFKRLIVCFLFFPFEKKRAPLN